MDCLIFGAHGYLGSRIFDHFNVVKNNVVIGTQANSSEITKNFKIIKNYRSLNENQLRELIQQFDLVIDATELVAPKLRLKTKLK